MSSKTNARVTEGFVKKPRKLGQRKRGTMEAKIRTGSEKGGEGATR